MCTRSTEYRKLAAQSFYICMCVPRNPPEVRLRLLLIRRHRLRPSLTSPSPSGFSRCHPIAKPFATGLRCPQVVATRPSRSVSRTLSCEIILSPRVRCMWNPRVIYSVISSRFCWNQIPTNCSRPLLPPWYRHYPDCSPRLSLLCRQCYRKKKTMKSSIR